MVIGGFLLVYSANNRVLWAGLLGSVMCASSIYWLLQLSAQQPVAALFEILREEPETIKWVYAMVTERHPFGLQFSIAATLYLVGEDGWETSIAIPKNKVLLVSKTLNRVLPHAEFGYTKEREFRYRGEVMNYQGGRFNPWKGDF